MMTNTYTTPVVLLIIFFCQANAEVPTDGTVIGCFDHEDCAPLNGSSCVSGNCTCPGIFPVVLTLLNSTYCLAGWNETGANCTYDQQCVYENGKCLDGSACGCKERFQEKDGQCAPYAKSALVPVAVGVAIGVAVLATLGLYLWLSRKKNEEDTQ